MLKIQTMVKARFQRSFSAITDNIANKAVAMSPQAVETAKSGGRLEAATPGTSKVAPMWRKSWGIMRMGSTSRSDLVLIQDMTNHRAIITHAKILKTN